MRPSPVFVVRYAGFIFWEVLSGTVEVAMDAFTPGQGATPMIVEYPLRCNTDAEVAIMASSITITPGTITLGIAPALDHTPATLFVHSMYSSNREELIESLHTMESKLLRASRGSAAKDAS